MHKVAYLGPEKTNTHIAARRKFGAHARYIPCGTVEEVFQAVERKKVDFGVVAIENSLEGAVTHTLDRFIGFEESPLKIYGEIDESINHYLMMSPQTSIEKIRVVYSHPSALEQCREWLSTSCPSATSWETNSTAKAIEYLFNRKERLFPIRERAAIGRLELAEEHRLKAIPISIDQENRTRFLILSLQGNVKIGRRTKTSLMCALSDKPGALYDALRPFKRYKINLTKIESRPSKKKAWEYIFFIDFEGHKTELRVKKALKSLEKSTSSLKVLGSYPTGS